MSRRSLLEAARAARGLTQEAVARRSGTSQPTLSAYERGTRSPTLSVVERILHTLDFDLGLNPRIAFREVHDGSNTYVVPNQLWRLDPDDCFVPFTVTDRAGRHGFFPIERPSRVAAYRWLMETGDETQLISHLDGALLVDAWGEIAPHLPTRLRDAWQPLVTKATEGWLIDQLRAGLTIPPKPASPKARERAIRRLAEHGLTEEEIRAVLEGRRNKR
ncbi:MAG: helix-turn-helix transcriptional regulator [Nocardioidaceae bacterium]